MLWVQAIFTLLLSEGATCSGRGRVDHRPCGDPFLMPVATRGEAISCLRE